MEISIKDLRSRSEMSQQQFADYLGISVNTLRSWEAVCDNRKPMTGLTEIIYRLLVAENVICPYEMPVVFCNSKTTKR